MDTSKPWNLYRVSWRDCAGLPPSERGRAVVSVAWVVACSSRRAVMVAGVPAPRVFLGCGYGRWGYWVACPHRQAAESGGTFNVSRAPTMGDRASIPGVVLVDAEF